LKLWYATEPRPTEFPPGFSHLSQNPIPFFTPTLDSKLPETVYYIEHSQDTSLVTGGTWLKLKAKGQPGGPDLYVMQTILRRHKQNTSGAFYRASDLIRPAIEVGIDPIPGRPDKFELYLTGRPITMKCGNRVRVETPDRVKRTAWTPRRFYYGGRRFVWKQDTIIGKLKETLYEVEKEWPKPGSKTGKKEDTTLERRLMWSKTSSIASKYHVLHFAGGLDQLFIESLLASQMGRMIVENQRG
jgi:hypothetical protein